MFKANLIVIYKKSIVNYLNFINKLLNCVRILTRFNFVKYYKIIYQLFRSINMVLIYRAILLLFWPSYKFVVYHVSVASKTKYYFVIHQFNCVSIPSRLPVPVTHGFVRYLRAH